MDPTNQTKFGLSPDGVSSPFKWTLNWTLAVAVSVFGCGFIVEDDSYKGRYFALGLGLVCDEGLEAMGLDEDVLVMRAAATDREDREVAIQLGIARRGVARGPSLIKRRSQNEGRTEY